MSALEPAETVEIADWMISADTAALMDALNADGQNALFVGGCVRNMLLGQPVEDIDIATKLGPQSVNEKLEAVGIKVIPTGIDHGTVTAVSAGRGYEITTLRKDIETDGRHAVVAFTDDWREDAARRDFTMNTLLADAQGNIFDPTGQGLSDLRAGRVVFVGEPAERIAEDYLRILRFFRFHAFYGQGAPDARALSACAAAADKISTLSKERITKEFLTLLSADDPVDVLNVMFKNQILPELCFKKYESDNLKHLCIFQKRFGLGFTASRLLMLAGLEEKNMTKIAEFLFLPKVFLKDINFISQVLNKDDLDNDHAVKVAVYKYGRVAAAQALMIELVLDRVMNGYAPKALDIIQNWDIPDFPVTGDDLIKQGIKPGPALGRKLQELEQDWIDGGFQAANAGT